MLAPGTALIPAAQSRAHHATAITAAWRKSLAAIIETGHALIAAKKVLAHGEFLEMVKDDLPFGPSVAERLMKIARDPRLAPNSARGPILPPSWRTLYELTKLSDTQLDALIVRRIIRPDMERRELERALEPAREHPKPKDAGARSTSRAGAASVPRGEVVPLHPQIKEAAAHFSTWRDDRKAREQAVILALVALARFCVNHCTEINACVNGDVAAGTAQLIDLVNAAGAALEDGEAMGFLDCVSLKEMRRD
jgi:hypothetical protein